MSIYAVKSLHHLRCSGLTHVIVVSGCAGALLCVRKTGGEACMRVHVCVCVHVAFQITDYFTFLFLHFIFEQFHFHFILLCTQTKALRRDSIDLGWLVTPWGSCLSLCLSICLAVAWEDMLLEYRYCLIAWQEKTSADATAYYLLAGVRRVKVHGCVCECGSRSLRKFITFYSYC